MSTLSNEAIAAITEAACEAEYVSDLGHYQTIRDRFIDQEEMKPIVERAIERSGFQPGDNDFLDLAQEIANQIGEALAANMVHGINDELEGMYEERYQDNGEEIR